jgi:hypothetical protein
MEVCGIGDSPYENMKLVPSLHYTSIERAMPLRTPISLAMLHYCSPMAVLTKHAWWASA